MIKNPPYLKKLRHTTEHVLMQAMENLYGADIIKAMGPATDDGFYFDFDSQNNLKISQAAFPKIEQEMQKIIKANLPIKKKALSLKQAREFFKNNPYKQEWLDEIEKKQEKATVYWTGDDFVDLCSGPHLNSTGQIKAFKLLSVAGAYWHGDEKNKMLTRIYGTAFPTQKELDQYLQLLKQAQKRDHRLLGQQLELFIFDDQVGQGLPLWLPKGAFLRHKIMEFAFNTYLKQGYQPVSTPHIASQALWQHSGHLDFYQDSMYLSFGIDLDQYRLKPMNCPFHVKMYQYRPRSYKELPLRWTEMGTVYRYEKSGVLHGLTRVRGFTQDDAHIICTPNQLHQELTAALKLTLSILKTFGFKNFEMNLSVRDPNNKHKFIGSDQGWSNAESALKKALADVGYQQFVLDVGGAVFYGPKIDVKVADSLDRKWQLSTIQIDFNLPNRFKMQYIAEDGKSHQPFMIHRALLGSLERFIGVYIEHTAGVFPVWLAPIQIKIIPISSKHHHYAQSVAQQLQKANLRLETDNQSLSMQKRIRNAELEKVPYILVVGGKEAAKNTVNVRQRGKKDQLTLSIDKFLSQILSQIETKALI